MNFLIDECLSPQLVKLAKEAGHETSSHVSWLGRAGTKDWDLMPFILAGDWTFVTCNSVDFRGSASNPGDKGQYARVELHAGLVCLNWPHGSRLNVQLDMFAIALQDLAEDTDMVNQALEVTLIDGEVQVGRYPLPKGE
jgi:hypothetical protein